MGKTKFNIYTCAGTLAENGKGLCVRGHIGGILRYYVGVSLFAG